MRVRGAATRKEAQQGERLLHMLVGKYVASRSHSEILVVLVTAAEFIELYARATASDTVCLSMCVILLPIQRCILGP
jgi:hypothetical protein